MLEDETRWEEAAGHFAEAWSRVGALAAGAGPQPTTQADGDDHSHLRHDWQIRRAKSRLVDNAYLALERVPFAAATTAPSDTAGDARGQEGGSELWEVRGDAASGESEEDVSTLPAPSSSQAVHYYDFHLVYNAAYQVPEVFLTGYGGGGEVLTIDCVVRDLCLRSSHSEPAIRKALLQKEHPHLLLPWISTHLCETQTIVDLLLGTGENGGHGDGQGHGDLPLTLRSMLSWWTSVGQFVGLPLPLHLLKRLKEDADDEADEERSHPMRDRV